MPRAHAYAHILRTKEATYQLFVQIRFADKYSKTNMCYSGLHNKRVGTTLRLSTNLARSYNAQARVGPAIAYLMEDGGRSIFPNNDEGLKIHLRDT